MTQKLKLPAALPSFVLAVTTTGSIAPVLVGGSAIAVTTTDVLALAGALATTGGSAFVLAKSYQNGADNKTGQTGGRGSDVDDILEGAKPGRSTKGKTRQWEKSGGQKQANHDFDSLKPSDAKEIPGGKTGRLADGRNATVRSRSSDGRPTVKIKNPNGTKIKIRYDD